MEIEAWKEETGTCFELKGRRNNNRIRRKGFGGTWNKDKKIRNSERLWETMRGDMETTQNKITRNEH